MLFFLKKFISYFFEPLTITFILLGVGIYYLCKKETNLKRAKIFIISGTVFLFIFSSSTFTYFLVAPLETKYPAVKDPVPGVDFEYIHVLGSGHSGNHSLPPNSRMGKQALSRVIEGIRLSRLYPDAKLIFSGYGGSLDESFAKVASEIALSLGVDEERIILFEEAKDTVDESRMCFELAGEKPVLLVSSASHLPRAAGLFKKLGMNVTPAPTDFINSGGWRFKMPNSGGVYRSERGIYEILGITWSWLTGKY